MKKIYYYAAIASFAIAVASCGTTENDSKKQAENANEAKIDSAQKADTVASASSHMADMKPDADFAVAAADEACWK